ncbi:N6-adenosine-methyltransferase TMT1A-like [Tigriopus californicus]|nr:N6-adenosine-methyltransferase TMT1A-like [Tigriopus californicus]|eukprot:TCALIF_07599-PA protein Name:"Similar to METTL7A Methyltransferase-like protein 7A (Homo sapiens)" AED:0.05 eAED:0.05 QI:149/1/1/1/1/1/3/190/241
MAWLYILVGVVLLLSLYRIFRAQLFAKINSKMCAKYNKMIASEKETLFQKLNEQAKAKGRTYTILELGGGSGTNFGFVKEPVHWVVTEPNMAFAQYFQENVKKNGGDHHISELIEAKAEDLSQFPNASMDAVVVSLVLCTVQDPQRVMNEVQRVLRPGGHFFFIEHVISQPGTILRYVQIVLSKARIWPFLFEGCQLHRDTGKLVKQQPGFAKTEVTDFKLNTSSLLLGFVRSHVYGVATR